jgi:dUTP pyrophosphatase
MEVKLNSADAYVPTRQSKSAAGFDLYSSENTVVLSKERKLVNTDCIIKIPDGYYGRIAPRSGLAVKKCIDIGAGVIDSDYRGVVKILIINNGENAFHICKGDRIAQLVVEKIYTGEIEIIYSEEHEMEETERGSGGFGSTGMN